MTRSSRARSKGRSRPKIVAPAGTVPLASASRWSRGSRLTPKQRAFVETLVADPNFNEAHAARAAGCGRGAGVTASKWLRLAKVQSYLVALTSRAKAENESRAASTVTSLEGILAGLSAIAEVNIADCVKIGADGKLELDHKALLAAPPGAVSYRQTKRGWCIESHAMRALLVLARNYWPAGSRRNPWGMHS